MSNVSFNSIVNPDHCISSIEKNLEITNQYNLYSTSNDILKFKKSFEYHKNLFFYKYPLQKISFLSSNFEKIIPFSNENPPFCYINKKYLIKQDIYNLFNKDFCLLQHPPSYNHDFIDTSIHFLKKSNLIKNIDKNNVLNNLYNENFLFCSKKDVILKYYKFLKEVSSKIDEINFYCEKESAKKQDVYDSIVKLNEKFIFPMLIFESGYTVNSIENKDYIYEDIFQDNKNENISLQNTDKQTIDSFIISFFKVDFSCENNEIMSLHKNYINETNQKYGCSACKMKSIKRKYLYMLDSYFFRSI